MAGDARTMQIHTRRSVAILSLCIIPSVFGQSACFDSIGAINTFMQTELLRIEAGTDPQASYTFNLCTNTFFDASMTTLEPVLNNAMFLCGEDGSRRNQCIFMGGVEQVRIDNSLVPGYPLQEVTFMGITFSSFESGSAMSGTSVAAFASATTTATFMDCAWQDFSSDFVVSQRATGSFFGPMTVQVEGGAISSGTGGVIFDNDGGLLRVSEIDVSDVTAVSLIATANNGASFLERSTITGSDLGSITFATTGGSQTVMGTTVSVMSRMEDGFYVEMAGSTLLLEDVTVEQNLLQSAPWSAVSARMGAVARVLASTIQNNAAMEFAIVSFDSSVSVSDTTISQNSGVQSQGTTSAAVFAITDATVSLERVEINENTNFAGAVVALIRSTVQITRSCFQGGNGEFLVFIANDANFQVSENFVENFDSNTCEATGPRLFQENVDSGCFLGASQCEGTCLVLADQTSCLAEVFPTAAPTTGGPTTGSPMVEATSAPTRSPSSMETILPTGQPQTVPTGTPTASPTTQSPILAPTRLPTLSPSGSPTATSSPTGSHQPSMSPSVSPMPTISAAPTFNPSSSPSLTPIKPDMSTKKKSMTSKGSKSKTSKGTKSKSGTSKGKGSTTSSSTSKGSLSKGKGAKMMVKKKRDKKKGKGGSSYTGNDDDLAHIVPKARAGLRHEGGVDIKISMDENGNWVSEETDPSGKDVTILELDEPPQRQR